MILSYSSLEIEKKYPLRVDPRWKFSTLEGKKRATDMFSSILIMNW